MTPEERAKMKDALLAAGERSEAIPYGPIVRDLSHGPFMDLCLDRIEGAIREAVMAEREACAKIADDSASRWDSQPDDDCASIACGDIAAAIRARTP